MYLSFSHMEQNKGGNSSKHRLNYKVRRSSKHKKNIEMIMVHVDLGKRVPGAGECKVRAS